MARDLKLVGVNCEPDLYAALQGFAAEHGVSGSEAARLLLRKALEASDSESAAQLVSRDLSDVGYRAGFRRGLKDVHEHMALLKPSR